MSECNYLYGNYSAEKRVKLLSQMLDFTGIEQDRLRARWVSSAEAPEFVEEVNSFIHRLKELGPSPLKATAADAAVTG